MAKVTQRDIVESVSGLRALAADLRRAADNPHDGGKDGLVVLLRHAPLLRHVEFLDQVANELANLIPDEVVVVPPDA